MVAGAQTALQRGARRCSAYASTAEGFCLGCPMQLPSAMTRLSSVKPAVRFLANLVKATVKHHSPDVKYKTQGTVQDQNKTRVRTIKLNDEPVQANYPVCPVGRCLKGRQQGHGAAQLRQLLAVDGREASVA